jgi:hypothetical protein
MLRPPEVFMKKTFLLLLAAASLLFSCAKNSAPEAGTPFNAGPEAEMQGAAAVEQNAPQGREPVYVNNFAAGPFICEFAVNGARQEQFIQQLTPYIQDGRVYFVCWAFPISSGSLRSGFEFNLDLEDEFISSPRIKAVYRGSQSDDCNNELCLVAGYAERGTIIITHAFFDTDKANEWGKTVRLASQQ